MANVLFKRGLEDALLARGAYASKPMTYEDGCFYLTTDTNHLYVGTSGNKLAKIDGNIRSVDSLPQTGEAGEFYYLKGKNILAYYDKSLENGSGSWVQLNPDTDTVIETTGISISKNVTQSTDSKLVYDVTLSQQKNNADMDDVTTTFEIKSEDVTSIVTQTSVDVGASKDTQGNVTIKTSGAGSGGTGFGISGANGISVGVEDKKITITGTEYDLSVDGNTVILEEGTAKSKKISIDGDSTWITTGANKTDSPDGVKISHATKTYNNSTNGSITAEESALDFSNASSFSAVTGVTYDNAGHIDSVTTTEFTVPEIDYSLTGNTQKIDSTDVNSELYTTSLALKNGTTQIGDAIPINIAFPITVDGEKSILHNGSTIGSFYSAGEIDAKLKGINAMTYKGPVSSNEDLPIVSETSKIRIGDTYKVNVDGTYAGHNCKVGYLLIANTTSAEDENGYITKNLYWDLIESGESSDTTYKLLYNDTASIILKENGTQNAGIIQFIDDKDTNGGSPVISFAVSEQSGGNIGVKASHINIETTSDNGNNTPTSIEYGSTFDVITGLTSDNHGHITQYNMKKYQLPAADTVQSNKDSHTLSIKNGTSTKGEIKLIAGDKITLASTADTNNTSLNTTINHAEESIETSETTSNPDYGSSFTAIKSVTTDGYGHISAITTDTVILPGKIEYSLSEVTKRTGDGITAVGVDLKTGTTVAGSIDFDSDTLDIEKDTTNNTQININLTWGTF